MSFPAIYLFSVTFFYKNLFFSSTYKKCDYIPLFILLKHSSLCDRKTIKSLVVCVIPGLFRLHKKTCSQTVLTDLHGWKQTVHLSSRTQNCNGVVVYRQLDLNMKQVEQKFSFARGSFFFFLCFHTKEQVLFCAWLTSSFTFSNVGVIIVITIFSSYLPSP